MVFLSQICFSQITTTKIVESKEKKSSKPYDSIQNFLGNDVYKYIGQDLYLKSKPESLRKFGYDIFLLDYTKNKFEKGNVYKCCDGYNSKYETLASKYFQVLDVLKHPKANQNEYLYGEKYYLKLKERETKDTVYFEYSAKHKRSFPFLVKGFYEKQKKKIIGEKIILTDKILSETLNTDLLDISNREKIIIKTGETWKCVDLTIEENFYSLAIVIENSKGNKTLIPFDKDYFHECYYNCNNKSVYSLTEANKYIKKFGTSNFNLILKGKIKIGMTKEMIMLSWGEPKKINRASYGDQWVYENQYLYFKEGKLSSFN